MRVLVWSMVSTSTWHQQLKLSVLNVYRDEETLEPVEYLVKLPEDIDQRQIFVVDPMLATGGSAILAVDSLKKREIFS